MQYLFFVRVAEDANPSPEDSDPEPWVAETTRKGQRLLGDRLRPESDATVVRVRDGETLVVDGPFAEAREQIAGFDLIEAVDDDEAIAIAAAHPAARFGAIEIRALWPFDSEGAP